MQNEIKISIPKPCHENWNEMTPNEQGSFCGKCCKTVLDFSTKTPEEIKSTLLNKKGENICGRFTNNQLNESKIEPVSLKVPFFLLPKNISYQKAFGIALFLVFGTGLFSCVTEENHLVGKIEINDTLKTQEINLTDSVSNEYSLGQATIAIKGEVKVDPVKPNVFEETESLLGETDTTKKDSVKYDPDKIKMGKIKITK